jgi:hypothetical protein
MLPALLRSRIAAAPKAALILGKVVFLAGAVLILAAVFARAGMLAPAWAWLAPRGTVGYLVAAVLVLVGMALVVTAGESVPKDDRQRQVKR